VPWFTVNAFFKSRVGALVREGQSHNDLPVVNDKVSSARPSRRKLCVHLLCAAFHFLSSSHQAYTTVKYNNYVPEISSIHDILKINGNVRRMSVPLVHSRVYLVLLNEVRAEILARRKFISHAAVLKTIAGKHTGQGAR